MRSEKILEKKKILGYGADIKFYGADIENYGADIENYGADINFFKISFKIKEKTNNSFKNPLALHKNNKYQIKTSLKFKKNYGADIDFYGADIDFMGRI